MQVRFNREGTHVYLWLTHVDVWQTPTQYCKVISLQLNKNKLRKKYIYREFPGSPVVRTLRFHSRRHGFNPCAWSLSRVWLFVTPWTVAHQAPLSMQILQTRILEWVAMISSIPGGTKNSPAAWLEKKSLQNTGRCQTSKRARKYPLNWVGQKKKKRERNNKVLLYRTGNSTQ